jgi:hypothetical protein
MILVSCSVTKDSKRGVAGNGMPEYDGENLLITKKDYEADRGQKGGANWEFDGYAKNKAQKHLFGKALISVNPLNLIYDKKGVANRKANRKFLITANGLRADLMKNNLHDTGVDKAIDVDCKKVMYIKRRTPNGDCYLAELADKMPQDQKDLAMQIYMGSKGTRFGRNTKTHEANKASRQNIMEPNPFKVSQKLFNRKDGKMKAAEVVNLLAAAWLQSMNHDWFSHGKNSKKRHHEVPAHGGHKHKHFQKGTIKVPHTMSENPHQSKLDNKGYDYTSRNTVTHWWDASQIYGSDEATIKKVRTKYNADGSSTNTLMPYGKIAVDEDNKRLYYDNRKLPITGFHDNWWLGLEMIHTLFHLEHNRIVDKILRPQIASGEVCKNGEGVECDNELFEKARLINSALLAKIHTVEWTPALLDHPMLHIGMRGNWFGLKELWGGNSVKARKVLGKKSLAAKHTISGLVGPETMDLYGAPFTLTEEFVAVYRMHSLIPEKIDFRSSKKPSKIAKEVPLQDVIFRKTAGTVKKSNSKKGSSLDWMLSFGTSHPGGLLLNNYPTFMQNFVAERNTGTAHGDSTRMDMGAIDILRDRERGVPRYNDFRRALSLPPIESWEDLTEDKEEIASLRDVYGDNLESLDLLVGSLAEKDRYAGYAFGNTPFWIFAIMASRRLMADPFFSDYYVPSVYTAKGISYVNGRDMKDVILSHFPELKSHFYTTKTTKKKYWSRVGKKRVRKTKTVTNTVLTVKNAFRPWNPVYDVVKAKLK